MNHMEWDINYADVQRRLELRKEHNATVRAYRDAMAECDRLGKANDDACDTIAEMEKAQIDYCANNFIDDPEFNFMDAIRTRRRMGLADKDRKSVWPKIAILLDKIELLESRPALTWEECEAKYMDLIDRAETDATSDYFDFRVWLQSRLPAPTDSIRVPFSDAQIEALARVLIHAIDGISELDGCSGEQQDKWRMVARAAVDFMRAAPPENLLTRHLLHQTGQADIGHALETISDWKATALRVGPPVAVDPDAWKTPLEITDDDGSSIELAHRGVTFEVVSRGDTYPHLSPADAARAAQWLASYAAAHGCPVGLPPMMGIDPAKPGSEETVVRHFCTGPTRAEAEEKWETVAGHMTMPARAFIDWLLPQLPTERAEMPTPNDLARIIRRHATVERWDHVTAEAILAALRPWFREPTGWELDVDPGWHLQGTTNSFGLTRAAVDYLTSRIRPTFECAECEQWRKDWDSQSKAYEILSKSNSKACKQINTIRAALEGE